MKVRNMFFAIMVGVFLISGPVSAAANPWGQYGQNAQNTGMSNYTGSPSIDYTWNVPLDYNNRESFVSPVVDEFGTVYVLDSSWGVSSYVNGQRETSAWGGSLKAISKSGGIIWAKEMGTLCIDDYGSVSMALGTNGILYLSCGGGTNLYVDGRWEWQDTMLYAFETASGALSWELALEDDELRAIGNMTIDSQNRIYLVSATSVLIDGRWLDHHAVTAVSGTGSILWRTVLGEGREWDMSGPVLSDDESKVYIYRSARQSLPSGYWRGAYIDAVNTETGISEWELPLDWGGTGWQFETSFTVDGNGTIWLVSYVKDDPDYCYGRGEYLIGISPNGTVDKQFPFEGHIDCGSHIRVGPSGTIYFTYDDTGEYSYWDGTRWLYRTTVRSDYGRVYKYRYWDGSQYVYGDGPFGGLAAYDPVDGFKWKFSLPDSFEANASPAIDAAENIYFAASFGERLYSLNKDGQLNWMYDIDPTVEPTKGNKRNSYGDEFPYGVAPVIGRAGSIYVMGSKTFYAINNDIDGDGVANNKDNCLSVPNTDQKDANSNDIGDLCDGDTDGDGKPDIMDNCPFISNASQDDLDKDGWGDACDPCEGDDPENSCDSGEGDVPSDIAETTIVSNITETASVSFDPGFVSGTFETYSVTVEGESAMSNFAYASNQHNLGSVYTFSITPTPFGNFSTDTVEITLTYDQGFMPEDGQMENNLDIYYYDTVTLEWEPQNALQNVDNNTLTTHVDHFSSYAVIMTENPVSDLIGVLKDIEIGNEGFKNSLRVKLEKAHDFYDEGKATAAGNILAAFINEVKAQSGKKIDSSSADVLIQLVQGLQSGS